MKDDSEYERSRQAAYAPLVERVHPKRRDKIFIYTLSCGIGWKKIVFDVVDELDKIWDGFKKKKGRKCWSILQIKEKFGGLRFYASYSEDKSDDAKARFDRSCKAISKATDEAAKTCERCGDPGKLQGQGYIATVCKPCLKRWEERTKKGLWPTLFG